MAIVQPGQKPEEAINALIAELDRLKNEPITDRELQRTKNQFARDYILGRESNQQKAAAPRRTRSSSTTTSRRRTASSTSSRTSRPADVQRVAHTYFTTENRLVLTLMPSGGLR